MKLPLLSRSPTLLAGKHYILVSIIPQIRLHVSTARFSTAILPLNPTALFIWLTHHFLSGTATVVYSIHTVPSNPFY